MNKIFSKMCLGLLIFSSAPMHASGIFTAFQKHSSALWTSLYLLGSAAAVYACYKDVEIRMKELETKLGPKISKKKQELQDLNGQISSMDDSPEWQDVLDAKIKEIEKIEVPIKKCAAKPAELAMVLGVLGIVLKVYCNIQR